MAAGGNDGWAIDDLRLMARDGIRIQDDSSRFEQGLASSIGQWFTALQRRKLFDEVSLIHNDDPQTTSLNGYHFLIYLLNTSPTSSQWYIKATGKPEAHPVVMDMRKPSGVPRLLSWLDSIEELAKAQTLVQAPDAVSTGTAWVVEAAVSP